MKEPDLLHKEKVYKIVGAAMEVHKELGPGFLEAVYQEALAIEFNLQQVPYQEQVKVRMFYKNNSMKAFYVPDYLCYEGIVVEIKAMKKCTQVEEAQIINALKATRHQLGLLINFGEPSLFWKRFILQKGLPLAGI